MPPGRPASRDTCQLWGSFRRAWPMLPAGCRLAAGNGAIPMVQAPLTSKRETCILAVDSYNRGYNVGVGGLSSA